MPIDADAEHGFAYPQEPVVIEVDTGMDRAGVDTPEEAVELARRVPALEAFAALSAALLAPGILARQRDDTVRNRIERVITTAAFGPVFQPIVALDSGTPVGYEALTRFADGSRPDRQFADADAIGLGLELEIACLAASLDASRRLPAMS